MYNSNNEAIARKALAYAICFDMVKAAISNIGRVNGSDHTKVNMIVYDEIAKATTDKTKTK